jgi:hypothetical protein
MVYSVLFARADSLQRLTPVGFSLSRYSRRAPTGRSESFAQHSLNHGDERGITQPEEARGCYSAISGEVVGGESCGVCSGRP